MAAACAELDFCKPAPATPVFPAVWVQETTLLEAAIQAHATMSYITRKAQQTETILGRKKIAEHIGVSDNQPLLGALESLFFTLWRSRWGSLRAQSPDVQSVPAISLFGCGENVKIATALQQNALPSLGKRL